MLHIYNGSVAFSAPMYPGDSQVEIKVLRIDLGAPVDAELFETKIGDVEKDNGFFLTGNSGKFTFFTHAGEYRITARRGDFSETWDNVMICNAKRTKINPVASFTLERKHDYCDAETTGSNNIIISVPTEATLNLGPNFEISGVHLGSGTLDISETGITLKRPEGLTNGIPPNSTWTLRKSAFGGANVWSLCGFLNAEA